MMIRLDTVEATLALGVALGNRLRAGDLVILSGSLGAGKTTLTKGIATRDGRVRAGDVTDVRHRQGAPTGPPMPAAPSRWCTSMPTGWPGRVELDDLDLDTDLDAAAVVIEWGEGVAEQLSGRAADHRAGPAAGRHPDRRADPGRRVLAGQGGRDR